MRITSTHRRLVASILVIGLLAVALTFVCSEGVHFFSNMGRDCAIMSHADGVTAVVGSESGQTLLSGLMVVAAAFVMFVFRLDTTRRLVPMSVSPGIPPDPLHGRFRH